MGSTSRAGWTAGPTGTDRVTLVGDDEHTLELMRDALTGYDVAFASRPTDLDPVLGGDVETALAVVDTDRVTADVTALVDALLERTPVVLLASDVSPEVRQQVARRPDVTFREKPIRIAELRTMVGAVLD